MEKKFFDVFSSLVVSDDDRELMEETKVTRLVSSSRRDKLHIHLVSDYIIPKDRIYEMERKIGEQYYPNSPVSIRIIEKFNLGDAYTAKAIISQYKGSVITEASNVNPAWVDLLKHADYEFNEGDNAIALILEDRPIAHDMSEEIADFLDHVINGRCRTSFKITVSFKEKETRQSYVHSRERMLEEVRKISFETLEGADVKSRDDDRVPIPQRASERCFSPPL